MCTMTWFVHEDGYELFFNRDERVSRSHADLPKIQHQDGIRYISPTDTDAGGTWIALNQFGVAVCLLNHYQFEQIATYKDWISRGEIVRQFATIDDPGLAEHQFMRMELEDYRAFRMFVINPGGENRLCVWDGHAPRVEPNVTTPKSSSSVDARHVKSWRRSLFVKLGLHRSTDSADFLRYHASHLPFASKESVCMHREDANTVSLSHLTVRSGLASFAYADGPPCEAELGAPLTMPLSDHVGEQDSSKQLPLAANV